MDGAINYVFTAKLWQHKSPGAWYFISLPINISKEIRAHLKWQEEGWGRMKAEAKIGESTWETAIWFDTKRDTYILPIKVEIRTKNNLKPDQEIAVSIWV